MEVLLPDPSADDALRKNSIGTKVELSTIPKCRRLTVVLRVLLERRVKVVMLPVVV